MVTGEDLSSRNRGFESYHGTLDGNFFTVICCKNCTVCLKKPKINENEAGDDPFKNQY